MIPLLISAKYESNAQVTPRLAPSYTIMQTLSSRSRQNVEGAGLRIKSVVLQAIVFGFLFAALLGLYYSTREQNSVEYHRAACLKARKDASWMANRTSDPKDVIRWWLKGRPTQTKYILSEQAHYEALQKLGYFTEQDLY